MRALTLFLLATSLACPALAQSQPSASGATGTRPLTANGKIQIGYDKRADYPTIKQSLGDAKTLAPKPTQTTTQNDIAPNAPQNAQNLNGHIMESTQGKPSNFTTKPMLAKAPTAPITTTPAAPKQRSDKSLRSDSSPVREAAAAAEAQAAAKAAADKARAEALGAALAAAQKAGAVPTGSLPALPTTTTAR